LLALYINGQSQVIDERITGLLDGEEESGATYQCSGFRDGKCGKCHKKGFDSEHGD
jgi:hypothetical protein